MISFRSALASLANPIKFSSDLSTALVIPAGDHRALVFSPGLLKPGSLGSGEKPGAQC